MEFVVLALLALLVAASVVLPPFGAAADAPGVEELRARREELLRELRDLDEDLATGRISAEDRAAGRRAVGPGLRSVTEALRERGDDRGGPR